MTPDADGSSMGAEREAGARAGAAAAAARMTRGLPARVLWKLRQIRAWHGHGVPSGEYLYPEAVAGGDAARLLTWIRDYVGKPHPELGRNGAICPFVPTALRKHRLQLCIRNDVGPEDDPRKLGVILLEHAREFQRRCPVRTHEDELNCIVVGFPGLTGESGTAVDFAHASQKSFLMSQGLMSSQFHSDCHKPGARNPDFELYRSPFPCLVIRPMGVHDITFLDYNRIAFAEYQRRFGRDYDSGQIGDEHGYLARYRAALERFDAGHR